MTPSVIVSGTAFTAVSVSAKDRSKQKLSEEQIFFNKSQTSSVVKSDFVYETKEDTRGDKQIVVFDDTKSEEKVAISLDKQTVEKLKTHFGEDDVYARQDGIVRLDNKAEAFVSGWFQDIAYKREVLDADMDGDGKINDQEYRTTKSFMHGYIEIGTNGGSVGSIKDVVTENYADGSGLLSNDYVQHLKSEYTSLDNILNDTINSDSNYDKNITLEETLKFVYKTSSTTVAVAKDAKDLFGQDLDKDISKTLDKLITKEVNKKQQDEEKQKKKLEALKKLIASGGDAGVLNAEERALVQNELARYSKTDDKYDTKELQNLYDTMQKTKEYKDAATKDDTTGLYYEDRS